jgi:hypothetical protein
MESVSRYKILESRMNGIKQAIQTGFVPGEDGNLKPISPEQKQQYENQLPQFQ